LKGAIVFKNSILLSGDVLENFHSSPVLNLYFSCSAFIAWHTFSISFGSLKIRIVMQNICEEPLSSLNPVSPVPLYIYAFVFRINNKIGAIAPILNDCYRLSFLIPAMAGHASIRRLFDWKGIG
jgi:hypothetical protein